MKTLHVMTGAALLLTLAALAGAAEQPQLYKGKLDAELSSSSSSLLINLTLASPKVMAMLPAPPPEDATVYGATWTLSAQKKYQVAVVSPKSGEKYVYIDLNGDGKFSTEERYALGKGDAEVKLPFSVGMFKNLTVRLRFMDNVKGVLPTTTGTVSAAAVGASQPPSNAAADPGGWKPVSTPPDDPATAPPPPPPPASAGVTPAFVLVRPGDPAKPGEPQSPSQFLSVSAPSTARGTVDIEGRRTLVEYAVSLDKETIDPLNGSLAVDSDGDGKIDRSGNVEVSRATGQPEVFRVGAARLVGDKVHYVATKSVDVNTGEIVMEAHPAADYNRLERIVGGQVPDFQFLDLDGKQHKLSEYHAKYLLLDYWGSW